MSSYTPLIMDTPAEREDSALGPSFSIAPSWDPCSHFDQRFEMTDIYPQPTPPHPTPDSQYPYSTKTASIAEYDEVLSVGSIGPPQILNQLSAQTRESVSSSVRSKGYDRKKRSIRRCEDCQRYHRRCGHSSSQRTSMTDSKGRRAPAPRQSRKARCHHGD